MQVYLGLGSNLDDKRAHLRRAIGLLKARGLRNIRVSPVVESPALLPEQAPSSWNQPYLNLIVEAEAEGPPQQWRQWFKDIEAEVGETQPHPGAPRAVDIDILLWGRERINEPQLTIPRPDLHLHGFTLSPLVWLRPELTVPGLDDKTALDWSRELTHHIPLWMCIINVTPDSFSDGGLHTEWATIEPQLARMDTAGGQIIDIGAESTRPRAVPVTPTQEWSRLAPVLERLKDRYRDDPLRPLISIDTRHPETAAKALAWGVDIVNDVSGLTHPAMQDLARSSNADWIAMHHLTIPADPTTVLPEDRDPCAEVENWLLRRMHHWDRAGLDLNRIIFDPGIGFGKNSLQSLELLRHAGRFRRHGLRLLIGHSRKSFMKDFIKLEPGIRDLATLGASLQLCQKGVDIIRVHDIPMHMTAYRAWAHLLATTP